MKKQMALCLLLFLSFAACRNEDDGYRFKVLSESMEQYEKTIDGKADRLRSQLLEKTQDPQTASRAVIWSAKLDSLSQMADSTRRYIDYLRTRLIKESGLTGDSSRIGEKNDNNSTVQNLFEKQGYADSLCRRLAAFNKKSLSFLNPDEYYKDNSWVLKDLEKAKEMFGKNYPLDLTQPDESTGNGKKPNPITAYFKNAGVAGALSMLEKLRVDIGVTEGMMGNYFNALVPQPYHGFEAFYPLTTINSSNLKAGQPIEITAGLGGFSVVSKPTFVINGKNMPLNTDGVAVYNTIATGKPGRHFIPVTITYFKPDGSQSSISKKIEYTISE